MPLDAASLSNTDTRAGTRPLPCHNLQDGDMTTPCVPAKPVPSARSLSRPGPLVFRWLTGMKWACLRESAGKPRDWVGPQVPTFMSDREEQWKPE